MSRPLTWMYRKLGRRYPAVFVSLELPNALVVAAMSVALFSFYYSLSKREFFEVLAIALSLTAVGIATVLVRVLRRLRPLQEWIGGARSSEETVRAWKLAVNMPMLLVRRDWFVPVLVTVPTVIASVVVLGLNWLSFFPIAFAAFVAVGYAGILHYLAL